MSHKTSNMRIDITTIRSKDAVKDMNREAFPETVNNLTADPALGLLSVQVVSNVTKKGSGVTGCIAFPRSLNRRRQ